MIFPVSKPHSICWVRFNTWAVQDLPGRKSACSGIIIIIIIIMLLFRTVVHQDTCIHSIQLNIKKKLGAKNNTTW